MKKNDKNSVRYFCHTSFSNGQIKWAPHKRDIYNLNITSDKLGLYTVECLVVYMLDKCVCLVTCV